MKKDDLTTGQPSLSFEQAKLELSQIAEQVEKPPTDDFLNLLTRSKELEKLIRERITGWEEAVNERFSTPS